MVCYIVPAAAALISTTVWSRKRSVKRWWLNLMLYGGALFGFVDHLWNGELFLISSNPVKEFMLGIAITATIFAAWGIIVAISKTDTHLAKQIR